jgi:hypothetical protein
MHDLLKHLTIRENPVQTLVVKRDHPVERNVLVLSHLQGAAQKEGDCCFHMSCRERVPL